MCDILIIDDDPAFGRLMAHHAMQWGYSVQIANSVTEGASFYSKTRSRVIYLDLHLGEEHGPDFMPIFHKSKVILTTADRCSELAKLVDVMGGFRYWCKTDPIADLESFTTAAMLAYAEDHVGA